MPDWGLWASIIIGLGVAGHAVVGTVLTTRLASPTSFMWNRFGTREHLLRLNGTLLVVASSLHLVLSGIKSLHATPVVFWTSVAPFPFFAVAGHLERVHAQSWRMHHVLMAVGWLAFAGHGAVALR